MSAPIQEGYLDFSHPSLSQPAKTWYRVYGDLTSKSSGSPLVVLNGGPGASYHYMTPVADLASGKASPTPVVFYDQIGTGQSTHFPDKKGDGAFWSMELFLADLENLLKKLGIDGQFDILGHSWGGMLGASLAIKQPAGLRRLVLADTLASMPLWVEGTNRLLRQLPEELQEVIRRCEADGKTDSEEYERATQVFYSKFVCRLDPWPEELATSLEWMAVKDPTVYSTCMGPSEFTITGSFKSFNIVGQLHKIAVPTLMINGRYDEAQDSTMAPFFSHIQKVKWITFAESSHMPHWEERERYIEIVGDFLRAEI